MTNSFLKFSKIWKNDQPISNWNNSMNIAYIEAMKLESASAWLYGSPMVEVQFHIFVWISTKNYWSHSKICCFFSRVEKRLFLAFRRQFQMGPLADSKRTFNELHSHIFRIFIHATLNSAFWLEDEWQLSFHLRNFHRTSIFFKECWSSRSIDYIFISALYSNCDICFKYRIIKQF